MVCKMCITYSINHNIKIAVNISEKSLIKYWNFIAENNLYESTVEEEQLLNLSSYYMECCRKYISEVKKVSTLSPSFPIYNSLEYRILIYEVVGILSTFTYYLYYYYGINKEVKENIDLIITIINNNVAFYYPIYDLNCIEINILVFLLKEVGSNQAEILIDILLNRVVARIVSDNYYPVEYENYQKALDMVFDIKVEECKATLLITNLLEWLYTFNDSERIKEITEIMYKKFPNITFNSIEIDKESEKKYFNNNVGDSVISYILNYHDLNEVERIINGIKKEYQISKYNCCKYSVMPYLFIVSRNYRLPLPSLIIYSCKK